MKKDDIDNKNRRKDKRISIINRVLEPIELTYQDPNVEGKVINQPAILSNLSAGGMSLMTFMEPPKTNVLEICLDIPNLEKVPIKGKVSWVRSKAGVYMTGIAFTEINKNAAHKITMMAEDFEDCETRIALHIPEVCVEKCKCHYLCNKPQKDDSLFEEEKEKTAK